MAIRHTAEASRAHRRSKPTASKTTVDATSTHLDATHSAFTASGKVLTPPRSPSSPATDSWSGSTPPGIMSLHHPRDSASSLLSLMSSSSSESSSGDSELDRRIEHMTGSTSTSPDSPARLTPSFAIVEFETLQVGQRLGGGKNSDVFLAHMPGSDQPVAVKVLRLSKNGATRSDTATQAAFTQECKLLRHLPPHRNVVTAFGVCRFPPALLTGYCAKGSLDQIVRKKRLSVRRLLVCLMDAAAGVGHLHRHGVIHCDLAARNLLMDEQSVVKVCDFGMAHGQIPSAMPLSSSAVNSEAHPVKWMAPESIEQGIFNESTDSFSFAVVAWELSERQMPFARLGAAQAAVAVAARGTRLPRPLATLIPDELWELMTQCWSTLPDTRPSMADITRTLHRIVVELARNDVALVQH